MSPGTAPPAGWCPDPERPGYFRDPGRPGYLRDASGRWYSRVIIDNLARQVDAAAGGEESGRRELVDSLREAARRRGLLPP